MKIKILFFFLALIIAIHCTGQKKQELKKAFVNGEFALLYEEYKEALPLFLELLNAGRNDAYINHRIGICYLNIQNQKDKAIPYLEKAVEDVTTNHNTGYFTEKNASISAYYDLGVAYRIDGKLHKAIEMFSKYKEALDEENKEELLKVDAQLTACNNALELQKTPTDLIETNLGKNINTAFPNVNAVVSADEQTLVYASELRFYSGVFYSTKRDGRWLPARNISLQFESDNPVKPVFLTKDGKKLYLVRNDNDDYNIYTSSYEQNAWQPLKKLNSKINTKSAEIHAAESNDGQYLYFVSNKEGGLGGFDIYIAKRNEFGDWENPVNAGNVINTPFNETTPFTTEDDKTLYFSSEGHFNIGGYDIFTAEIKNDQFKKPINLGYPFNTTDDDVFFFPLKTGEVAYYSKFKPTGYGQYDIYKIRIFSKENIPEKEKELNINPTDSIQTE